MASRLEQALLSLPDVSLGYPVEANLVFVKMPRTLLDRFSEHGHQLNFWPQADGSVLARFVTAFNTREEDIQTLIGEVSPQR
jgi:threonine aldolase